MTSVSLNQVYSALMEAKKGFPSSRADLSDIRIEAEGADAELSRDIQLFQEYFHKFQQALLNGDTEEQGNMLVYVRIYAMNLSSIFSNLADAIAAVAFTEERG